MPPVAATRVEKLVRRHPHVFADGAASNPEEVEAEWARIKAAEKPERDANDPLAGIPAGLPPLERAVKVVGRLTKAGQAERVEALAAEDSIGAALLDLVVQARGLGVDPSVALSATLSRLHAAPLGDHLGGIDHVEHAEPHPAPPDADLPRGGG